MLPDDWDSGKKVGWGARLSNGEYNPSVWPNLATLSPGVGVVRRPKQTGRLSPLWSRPAVATLSLGLQVLRGSLAG